MRAFASRTRVCRAPQLAFCCMIGAIMLFAGSCTNGSKAPQPIAFSHRVHIAKKLSCTFCHSGARKYRLATIPSVTTCMSCHSVVKTDSSEIQKVKSYSEQGREIPWRRIYRLPDSADVFFNHHRHAEADIKCPVCHGDVGSRDSLEREVNLEMGFCVRCHRQYRDRFQPASLADDCATCHR